MIISKQEELKPQIANNLNESQNRLVEEKIDNNIREDSKINKGINKGL